MLQKLIESKAWSPSGRFKSECSDKFDGFSYCVLITDDAILGCEDYLEEMVTGNIPCQDKLCCQLLFLLSSLCPFAL